MPFVVALALLAVPEFTVAYQLYAHGPESVVRDNNILVAGGIWLVAVTVAMVLWFRASYRQDPGSAEQQVAIAAQGVWERELRRGCELDSLHATLPVADYTAPWGKLASVAMYRYYGRNAMAVMPQWANEEQGSTEPVIVLWRYLDHPLPAMTFARANTDKALIACLDGERIDIADADLFYQWSAHAEDPSAVQSLLSTGWADVLGSVGQGGLVVSVADHMVTVMGDGSDRSVNLALLDDLASALVEAIEGPAVDRRGDQDSVHGERPGGDGARVDGGKEAALKHLASDSTVRAAWEFVREAVGIGLVGVVLTLPVLSPWLFQFSALGVAEMVLVGMFLTAACATFIGAWWVRGHAERVVSRHTQAHQRLAQHVREVALARDLILTPRDSWLETGWRGRPFGLMSHIVAAPAAHGDGRWGRCGVACIEGDTGLGRAPLRLVQTRVAWVALPPGVPSMDLYQEGFRDRLANLIGGQDIDVESYAFNQMWRVRSSDPRAAHGVLQPLMIEFLVSIAERGIALHLEDDKVVVWDDGADPQVDFAARLDLAERFVANLPTHVRSN